MSTEKIAVVTGGNKGVGFTVVKGLCERFNGLVYLTSRDEKRGSDAINRLREFGYSPLFHQLDITDQASVDKFKEHIRSTHGGLDILINNAAIMHENILESFMEKAHDTMDINYFGTLRLCEALFPLLRPDARVINISSSAGHLFRIPSASLRAKFSDPTLTIPRLTELVNSFLRDATENQVVERGWGILQHSAYVASKVAVSAMSIIQHKQFEKEVPYRNISLNFVHPGWIKTDLNNLGYMTVKHGAAAPLFLALDAFDLKGQYVWHDCQTVNWYAETTPP